MSTYPRKRDEFLTWCQAHAPVWSAAPTTIGLSAPQTLAFSVAVGDLETAVLTQEIARQTALAATGTAQSREAALRNLAGDLVRTIRAFAQTTNNPNVYQLAQIPPPAAPGPLPPPGQPTDFKVELNPEGSITLRWKAAHPAGSSNVVYFVTRKFVGESGFTLLGASGERNFTDATIPFGTSSATYIVQAQRGQTSGPASQQLTVTFGVSGGLATIQNMVLSPTALEGEPAKFRAAA